MRFKVGSCAVMLLMVRRFDAALVGGGAGEKGFGDTRSFFTTTRRGRGARDEDEDADALTSFGFGGAGGGTYGDGFLTVLTFGAGSTGGAAACEITAGDIVLSSRVL